MWDPGKQSVAFACWTVLVFNSLLFIKQWGNFTTISNQNNFQRALIYRIEFP